MVSVVTAAGTVMTAVTAVYLQTSSMLVTATATLAAIAVIIVFGRPIR